ncbi:oxidative damage protection protein [Candidatus Marithioploca araucensis]|uniref:Probable Fe(2+)-trafficking protein n=1 Tax=Candidatus Marithioploca araucensis TaxID=70273 RepID=A0ABT7VSR7_9GAMM|nr:oxidative damage protection protein [Candidatus Marithioploca araucensis]
MTRMVNCVKLGKEAEGLKFPPYPGELGKKIYENISNEAWKMWVNQQTMLINEYRLSPVEPQARKMIEEEMKKFLFGEGAA